MLISALDDVEFQSEYPELAGRRVLITGVEGALGFDVVRAFAEAKTRLVVQTENDGPETQALAEVVAREAMDARMFPGPFVGSEQMLKFARDASQKFGGLDCVINLAQVREPQGVRDSAAVEDAVAEALAMPVLASRVAINRMRTMMSSGTVINILAGPRGARGGPNLMATIARTTLAQFTRHEAELASVDAIRVNAVVPADPISMGGARALTSSADVATLALHLASGRGHEMSGLIFEAYFG